MLYGMYLYVREFVKTPRLRLRWPHTIISVAQRQIKTNLDKGDETHRLNQNYTDQDKCP